MCKLDKKKGVDIGSTYLSDVYSIQFLVAIAQAALEEDLLKASFISVMADGSRDVSALENEVVYPNFAVVCNLCRHHWFSKAGIQKAYMRPSLNFSRLSLAEIQRNISQRDNPMTFSEFKVAFRNYEDTEKLCNSMESDNVLQVSQQPHNRSFKGSAANTPKKATHDTKFCRKKKRKPHDSPKSMRESPEMSAHDYFFSIGVDLNNSNIGSVKGILVHCGATTHIVNEKSKFVRFDQDFKPNEHFLKLIDGGRKNLAEGRGDAIMQITDSNREPPGVALLARPIPTSELNFFSDQ